LKTNSSLENKLKKLFSSQKLGVLATQQKKNPYTSLVAFACSDDMRRIVFATAKTTRKFANIISNSSVSFFVDNRSNKAVDFRKAIGVTVLGSVRQHRKNKNDRMMKLYLKKHPQLKPFVSSPSCVFLCIDVESFYIVERFQDVKEIHLKR
jgi:nitroimidazol reductase NimA-like FMN-containing flavoprotein (pyridoxamine 5'-phosphate oxidase superfamily)